MTGSSQREYPWFELGQLFGRRVAGGWTCGALASHVVLKGYQRNNNTIELRFKSTMHLAIPSDQYKHTLSVTFALKILQEKKYILHFYDNMISESSQVKTSINFTIDFTLYMMFLVLIHVTHRLSFLCQVFLLPGKEVGA